MEFKDKVAIITGGAGGIGRAIAEALHRRGVKVALADLAGEKAAMIADELGGYGAGVDVTDEASLTWFINKVERTFGPIDIFVSNAGLSISDGPGWGAADAPNAGWRACWSINVMASVYAARHLARPMASRGGVFVVTASAAGLLAQIGDAAYSATKAAAVSFAESLAITHADSGLQVHCVCPEGVKTAMVKGSDGGAQALSGYIDASEVANALMLAMEEQRFLVTTHRDTARYAQRKGEDRDRWIDGMRKLRRRLQEPIKGRLS